VVGFSQSTEQRQSHNLRAQFPHVYIRAQAKPCPIGYWCSNGTRPRLCADGYFGDSEGLTSLAECKICPPGMWCRAGFIRGKCATGYFCGMGASCPTPGLSASCPSTSITFAGKQVCKPPLRAHFSTGCLYVRLVCVLTLCFVCISTLCMVSNSLHKPDCAACYHYLHKVYTNFYYTVS
jgi:hypothetical protein